MSGAEGGHTYDHLFFSYVDPGARRSARVLIDLLRSVLPVTSVLDVGCGTGSWLAEWNESGVSDVFGLDGEYVDLASLAISPERFQAVDLATPCDLDRRFFLVQCLEVAEHIAESNADTLVRNLIDHGDLVLFSAAVPGQGGEHHVNEQPHSYWHRKFHEHGYVGLDFVRLAIRDEADVEPWYRFNTFLFAREGALESLPAELQASRLEPGVRIPDLSPPSWRIRNSMMKRLPVSLVTRLAVLKHRILTSPRRQGS